MFHLIKRYCSQHHGPALNRLLYRLEGKIYLNKCCTDATIKEQSKVSRRGQMGFVTIAHLIFLSILANRLYLFPCELVLKENEVPLNEGQMFRFDNVHDKTRCITSET
jgi:hypothetical protein